MSPHTIETVPEESTIILIPNEGYKIGRDQKVEEADFETAIYYSEYGKFQWILLGVSGLIYAACAISVTTLSFVLPSAQCDFDLSSVDKGKLSAMPLIGMIFGCGLWGSVANSRGRKTAILLSLIIDYVSALCSAFVNSFTALLICRFFSGFGIIGATSIIFSYMGEFIPKERRDSMLAKLEMFWNLGVIFLPGVAWALLNRSVVQFTDKGNFSPWRIFVIVCGVPSLISAVCLHFLPETPKFFISKGKHVQAKLVFQKIFEFNTGMSASKYPVISLEGECDANQNSRSIIQEVEESVKETVVSMKSKIRNLFRGLISIYEGSHIKYLVIVCFVDFGLMASYYTIVMWFPEIFERFGNYESSNSTAAYGICVISQYKDHDDDTPSYFNCDPSIDNKVFIETIIVGLSCLPTSISLSYLISRIGKKAVITFVAVWGLMLSGLATLLLNAVRNAIQTLILACVFEALTGILETVVFCVVVDLFPTNLRAIALSITATSGRLGAVFGNIVFGLLIDWNCIVPIYLLGALLLGSGILCLGLPKTDSYNTIH